MVVRRERWKTVCARGADQASVVGRSTSPLGRRLWSARWSRFGWSCASRYGFLSVAQIASSPVRHSRGLALDRSSDSHGRRSKRGGLCTRLVGCAKSRLSFPHSGLSPRALQMSTQGRGFWGFRLRYHLVLASPSWPPSGFCSRLPRRVTLVPTRFGIPHQMITRRPNNRWRGREA